MAEVHLQHVVKQYDRNVVAVSDLNLRIADGEFLVMVGPSGCGKSTVLRMVAGLEDVSGGTIHIGPRCVNAVPPKERGIAMVFQSYALYPHMDVYDNMAFGLMLRKLPRAQIEQKVHETAELLGLTPLLRRKPRQLSGGQRQRVAMGRAMVRDPDVFLFDEPLSNLDAKLRVQMRAELIRLHRRHRTTSLYVTHDQIEAMTMATRIAVMLDGVLQQVDTPQKLFDRPANQFVAGFIGNPAMNFVPARLELDSNGQLCARASGEVIVGLPDVARQRLASDAGREVLLGMRPEYIRHPAQTAANGETFSRMTVTVSSVESLGSEVIVHLTLGERELTARMNAAHAPCVGEVLCVGVDTNKVQLFDAASRRSLLL